MLGHGAPEIVPARCQIMRFLRQTQLFLLLIAFGLIPTNLFAAEPVDLLIVLAADVSDSIDRHSYELQRRGYADALKNPRVLDAIRSGPAGRIAVCLFEWSNKDLQDVVVDWMVIDGPRAANQFSDSLLRFPRPISGATSISGAIAFAVAQLDRAPYYSERRVIDISGDGINNHGPNPVLARAEALDRGITINGLVILNIGKSSPEYLDDGSRDEHQDPDGGLVSYYRDNVIGGPSSFVIHADDFNSFGEAIVKKLIVEIASDSEGTAHTMLADSER